jgi:hypothetical protein
MPTSKELSIIMRFKDEVTKKLQGLQRLSNGMRDFGQSLAWVSQRLSQVGTSAALLGAVITGPMALAFKNAEKYSQGVHLELTKLGNITNRFQVSIATAMLPTVQQLSNILASLLRMWESLGPAVQQQIVTGVLLTGIFATIGGSALVLVGKLMKIGSALISLNSGFFAMIAANLPLIAIMASLTALISLMFKFKGVANTVLSAIESLWLFFLNGINAVRLAFSRFFAWLLGMWEKQYALLGKLPGILGAPFRAISEGCKAARLELDKFGNQGFVNIENNARKIQEIFTTGEGSFSRGFDTAKEKLSELWDLMRNPPTINIQPVVERFDAIEEVARGTAQAMTNSFGQLFFNVFTGQLRNLKQVFADFGRQILQVLSQAIAKFILVNTIGKMSVGGTSLSTYFHSGGPVIKAHSGYLASDEVPAILQTGERVLSRREVGYLGGQSGINRLLSGSGGNININPVVVVKAWDVADIHQHSAEIKGLVSEAISNNGHIRKIIKEYC